jgi:lysophospholipid acyltransferase (LPLAT)-like uncharacterized protein
VLNLDATRSSLAEPQFRSSSAAFDSLQCPANPAGTVSAARHPSEAAPSVKLRSPWLIRIAALFAALTLRVVLGSTRFRTRSFDEHVHPANPLDERFIYAFWHETMLAPTSVRVPVNVLVSQSADGELITQVCERLGISVIRGSTTRGGVQGMREMLREGPGKHFAITPDGPRGPRQRVKSGVIFLAAHTGLPIVVWGAGFTSALRMKSWDRFVMPLPFSTITSVMSEPIRVPRDLDSEGIERYRLRVEEALRNATAQAEAWADQLAGRPPRSAELQSNSADAESPPALRRGA